MENETGEGSGVLQYSLLMAICESCKLRQNRWAKPQGFVIEGRIYCCIGCGFTGCTCIDPKRKKKAPEPVLD